MKFHIWIPHQKIIDTYFFFKSGFHKTLFLFVNIIQPVGDDTEDCRIELEPRSGVLEPREEKSITVHFIANRTVGLCVIEKSITVHFIANRMVGICVIEKYVTVHFIANRTVGVCVIEKYLLYTL